MLWHKLVAFAVLSLVLCQLHEVHSNVSNSGCKTNFTRVGDKCLQNFTYYYNWYEADRNCRSVGAELLSLQNATQLQQINQWLNNSGQSYAMDYWTSGNYLGDNSRTIYWQSTGQKATYLPWAAGQPQYISQCIVLTSSELFNANYKLSIKDCTSWVAAICEHTPQNYTSTNATRICLKPGSYETLQVVLN